MSDRGVSVPDAQVADDTSTTTTTHPHHHSGILGGLVDKVTDALEHAHVHVPEELADKVEHALAAIADTKSDDAVNESITDTSAVAPETSAEDVTTADAPASVEASKTEVAAEPTVEAVTEHAIELMAAAVNPTPKTDAEPTSHVGETTADLENQSQAVSTSSHPHDDPAFI